MDNIYLYVLLIVVAVSYWRYTAYKNKPLTDDVKDMLVGVGYRFVMDRHKNEDMHPDYIEMIMDKDDWEASERKVAFKVGIDKALAEIRVKQDAIDFAEDLD